MDAMFNFSEEELNSGAIHSHDESSQGSSPSNSTILISGENAGRGTIKRPSSLNVSKVVTDSILRDSTNATAKLESTPAQNVQKRQQKKKKRRAADSYSDISFNEKYKLTEELLGTGAHGVVKTCRDRVTKQEYAVKIISKARHPNRARVFKEIDIYYHCRGCENILSIIDFLEDDDYFYLVFQKMEGGPLLNHIMKRGRLTERETSLIVRDIANGLHFLHSKGMSHRDLKPENILVERADSLIPIKLCDFDLGSAIRLNSNKTTPISTPELSTPVGSVEFMAPEVVDAWTSLDGSLQMYDKRCDLWSLGVIIYIMLSGYPPFYGKCGHTCGWNKGEDCEQCQSLLFERIQDGEFEFPEKDWKYVSDGAKDLIKRLLVRDASLRLTAAEVLQHPWVKFSDKLDDERTLNTPELLQRHDSIRRLESFTKDALSITKMIEERKRMNHYRSRSLESNSGRSRTPSHHDDADEEDEVIQSSTTNSSNPSKRRILRKKRPQYNHHHSLADDDEDLNENNNSFDSLRRRHSSTVMTSGEEDDLACSFKTVIHRPTMATTMSNNIAHFYLPNSNDNPPTVATAPLPPPITPTALTPQPLMSVPTQLPILVRPPATVLSLQHHAHTDPDLLFYNQAGPPGVPAPPAPPPPVPPQVYYHPTPWLTSYPTGFIYGGPATAHPPAPPPPHGVVAPPGHLIMGPPVFRNSSGDCRRTVVNVHETRVMPPERAW